MQWDDLLGHEQQREWFRTALTNNRLATSFLFVGRSGIGKRTFARLLAKSLLCRKTQPIDLAPCGKCEDCAQVDASTHPDLIEVAKPEDKAFVPIELLIGEREKRMREGLCHDISMRPYGGRRKIAILDDADALNVEGANSLLKTLEEPPTDSILILVGSSLQRQLPTIRSRCQAIIFQPLGDSQVTELLLRHSVVETEEKAQQLAQYCNGSLAEAHLMTDPDLKQFRASLLDLLTSPRIPMMELAKSCGGIVDAAGKDAKVRRERLKLLLRQAASFYRGVTMELSNTSEQPIEVGDRVLAGAIQKAAARWNRDIDGAAACWQRCLTAIEHVDRNANQASLLETWSADIAHLSGA